MPTGQNRPHMADAVAAGQGSIELRVGSDIQERVSKLLCTRSELLVGIGCQRGHAERTAGCFAHRDMAVSAAKTERTHTCVANGNWPETTNFVHYAEFELVKVDVRIRRIEMQIGRERAVVKGQRRLEQPRDAR